MSINIRYPNITALSEREQLVQVKSYLHQLVEQLNNELPNIGTGGNSTQTNSTQTASTNTYAVQGSELSYYDLRTLIIQELQEVERLFDEFSQKMLTEYIRIDQVDDIIAKYEAEKIVITMDEEGNLYYELLEVENPSGGVEGEEENPSDEVGDEEDNLYGEVEE